MQGSGFRVQGAGFRVQSTGFRVQGAGCRVQGAGCRVQGSGFALPKNTCERETESAPPERWRKEGREEGREGGRERGTEAQRVRVIDSKLIARERETATVVRTRWNLIQ